jgi:PIN domain nuclease of toxin-antitoxin system
LSLYLADACALIDFYTEEPNFPADLRSLIEDATASIAVLATTIWEIAIKTKRSKLVDLGDPSFPTLGDMLEAHDFDLLPFDTATAEQAANLPPLHGDPFDRALVAAAQRAGEEHDRCARPIRERTRALAL